ncbi:hypothetical protein, partial [Methylobacterium sp. WL19]|uniref:hypothetical protein n=1 Tax=Methylobacterium sp. WL19 TaxID=2603896 RepID=UPI001650200F
AHWPGPPPLPQFEGVPALSDIYGRTILTDIISGRTIAEAVTASGLPAHEALVHATNITSAILEALDDALDANPPPEPAPPPRRRPA